MVDWAVVNWGEQVAPFHQVGDLDGDGCEFYAMIAAKRDGKEWMEPFSLLYLGLAYDQTVHRRIEQDHRSYNLVCGFLSEHRRDRDVLVMLGRLDHYSRERVSSEFVQDIEALLIKVNQPKFNEKHKRTYNGRPLVVISTGERHPIKRHSASSKAAQTRWIADGGRREMEELLADDA